MSAHCACAGNGNGGGCEIIISGSDGIYATASHMHGVASHAESQPSTCSCAN